MEKLKRGYYYLFYKFYKFSEAAPSRWMSDWKAGMVIGVLEIWSIFSIINYYTFFINNEFYLTRNYYIIIGSIIFILNYFAFIHTNVWKDYVKEFDRLPKLVNRKGSWLVFGIVLFVITNLIFSFYLMFQID